MIVTFEQEYLRELYEEGKASDKKHRFQPQIVRKYGRTIDLMKKLPNVMGLAQYGGYTMRLCMVTRRDFRR